MQTRMGQIQKKEGKKSMRTIHWHQAEVIELDYTEEFLAVIDMYSSEYGLKCDVQLQSTESEVTKIIATATSKNYDIDDIHEYAMNVLRDENYCKDVWAHHRNIE